MAIVITQGDIVGDLCVERNGGTKLDSDILVTIKEFTLPLDQVVDGLRLIGDVLERLVSSADE